MRPPRRPLSARLVRSGVRTASPWIRSAADRISATVGKSLCGFGNNVLRLDLGVCQSVGTRLPRPPEDFQPAVVMLGDGGAALDPVAGIDILAARQVDDIGMVNMAANDAVGADAAGLVG